jgi:DnaA-homolog protein
MRQLPLEISPPPKATFDNYLPGTNAEALASVRALAAGRLPEPIIYLWGAPGCGRSHLLQAAANENPGLMVADDVESLDEPAQQALFLAINAARDGGAAVIAAGRTPPHQLELRDDLRTRLAWGLVYQLHGLGEDAKMAHLRASAARRGLELPDEVGRYLLTRLPRDLYSLNAALELLDRYSLAHQRALTIPLVREALADPAARAFLPRQSNGG